MAMVLGFTEELIAVANDFEELEEFKQGTIKYLNVNVDKCSSIKGSDEKSNLSRRRQYQGRRSASKAGAQIKVFGIIQT